MPRVSIRRLAAVLASTIREPVKLARGGEAITYVGGDVPGAQRALGAWEDGTERASVVKLPPEKAQALSVALAKRNRQKTAVWFVQGEGPDVLHVLKTNGKPAEVRKALNRHGVSYMTLIPSAGGTTVHVIDQGAELVGPVKAFAAETGSAHTAHPGTAGYAQVTKLSRKTTEAIEGVSGKFVHPDPENPVYVPAEFKGALLALEPKYDSTAGHWKWTVAIGSHPRAWLAKQMIRKEDAVDLKKHLDRPLTPQELYHAELEGGQPQQHLPPEERDDGQNGATFPEDFYAA